MIGGAFEILRRQKRRRHSLEPRQFRHVIVDRFQLAVRGVNQDGVEAALFRLAGKQAAAHAERDLKVGLNARQHGEAAGDVEAADHHRNAGLAQRPREVERARKLIRLHANQTHHAEAIVALELLDDVLDVDPGIGLVHRADVDRDIGAEHVTVGCILGESIDSGE
jgi:hypothetical protein